MDFHMFSLHDQFLKKINKMPRSLWKGPFLDRCVLKAFERQNTESKIRLWSRRSVILPECIDQSFEIHTGKQFLTVRVTEDMIGHKFGEFASTRKKVFHKKAKVVKKK
jgi:small subunit ribosomal protein S19